MLSGYLKLFGFLVIVSGKVAAGEFAISSDNHFASYLNIYDVIQDKVRPYKLAAITGKLPKSTVVINKFRYKSFSIKSRLDIVDGYEIGGLAKLNIASTFLSGSGSVGFGYSDSLKLSSETFTYIIRMSYRTKIEKVDLCDSIIKLQAYDDVLDPAFDRGGYVVAGKRFGSLLDIIITGSLSESTAADSQEAKLETSIKSMLASFTAEGHYQKTSSSEVTNQQLSIDVQSDHLTLPFAKPLTLSQVPAYLQNVSSWIGENPPSGGVLEYVLEDLDDVAYCLVGRNPIANTDFTGADLLMEKVKRVVRRIDDTRAKNLITVKWVRLFEQCFLPQEYNLVEEAIATTEDALFVGQGRVSRSIAAYKNGSILLEAAVAVVDGVFSETRVGNFSVRSKLSQNQIETFEFLSSLRSFNITCLELGKSAHFSQERDEIVYMLYNASVLPQLLNSDTPLSFAKSCEEKKIMCKVINCDMGFTVCLTYTLPLVVTRGALVPVHTTGKYFDLLKQSFDYLLNVTHALDSRISSVNSYFSQFHPDFQHEFMLPSLSFKNFWGPRSVFSSGSKNNPIKKLHEIDVM